MQQQQTDPLEEDLEDEEEGLDDLGDEDDEDLGDY